jgi:hypothetical protein
MKLRFALLSLTLLVMPVVLTADTLVLTNGRRVQGELIGVYGREIEFEERDGGRRRTVRIPRSEIDRIEFDNGRGPFLDRDRDRDRGNDRLEGATAIPRGMRERTVTVAANSGWTDTGIEVRGGQPIYFQANGEWRWGPNRRDGANGEKDSPVNRGRPLPDRPAAALIGRVGDRDEYFFIGGDPGPYRARSSGRLYLGINDDVLTDNSGSLRVTTYY